QLEQRRLAGAVDADEADAVAGADRPREVLEQHAVARPMGDALEVEDVLAEPRDGELLEGEAVAWGRDVGDELLGGVDAELRLRRPGRRAAAQPGEFLA